MIWKKASATGINSDWSRQTKTHGYSKYYSPFNVMLKNNNWLEEAFITLTMNSKFRIIKNIYIKLVICFDIVDMSFGKDINDYIYFPIFCILLVFYIEYALIS